VHRSSRREASFYLFFSGIPFSQKSFLFLRFSFRSLEFRPFPFPETTSDFFFVVWCKDTPHEITVGHEASATAAAFLCLRAFDKNSRHDSRNAVFGRAA